MRGNSVSFCQENKWGLYLLQVIEPGWSDPIWLELVWKCPYSFFLIHLEYSLSRHSLLEASQYMVRISRHVEGLNVGALVDASSYACPLSNLIPDTRKAWEENSR